MHRGKKRARDAHTLESATDQHPHSVGIKATSDVSRGFNDTASYKAGLLIRQPAARERVGQDVVVQTRDATKPIDRDRTNFTQMSVQGGCKTGQVTYYPSVV